VYPWSVDITSQLAALASEASSQSLDEDGGDGDVSTTTTATKGKFMLSYRGLFNGSIPDPSSLQQGSPVMMMQTYIVFSA
jgi:hypothetical protein